MRLWRQLSLAKVSTCAGTSIHWGRDTAAPAGALDPTSGPSQLNIWFQKACGKVEKGINAGNMRGWVISELIFVCEHAFADVWFLVSFLSLTYRWVSRNQLPWTRFKSTTKTCLESSVFCVFWIHYAEFLFTCVIISQNTERSERRLDGCGKLHHLPFTWRQDFETLRQLNWISKVLESCLLQQPPSGTSGEGRDWSCSGGQTMGSGFILYHCQLCGYMSGKYSGNSVCIRPSSFPHFIAKLTAVFLTLSQQL